MAFAADRLHWPGEGGDAPAQRRPHGRLTDEPMMSVLARIAGETGAQPMRMMREFAALSFGPGKISFSDYVRLRLFDDAFWAGADKRGVAGRRRAAEIMAQANHADGHGLAANRLAARAYLSAFGFPMPPAAAIFAQDLAAPGGALLRTREQLREFLADPSVYPLIGRPVQAPAGVGEAVLMGVNADSDRLIGPPGRPSVDLDGFIEHVSENYAGGYLFERRPSPHAAWARALGGHALTVRLITVMTDQGARPFRLCATAATADGGEILLRLDPRTGAVIGASQGAGLDYRALDRHPQTGAVLTGRAIADWPVMRAMALEASRLLAPLSLIGWEIAPTDQGPVILGVDEAPDLAPHQLADRRGVLTADFQAFVAARREALAEAEQLRLEA
ncbi:sugar-transfer associated ATP-grasp domain-containing protein [Caulobacter sp. KR2-114]|uniref:sugar-transfer associated ATP-grasp domain-containing protein n=1 Tax=Caulobacter sp. KR2-114 TaxID=3400912 RepID=UPI003C0B2D77